MKKWMVPALFAGLLLLFASASYKPAQTVSFTVDTLAANLTVPWDIVFLPDKTMLFTERPGRVRIFRNNRLLAKTALTITDIEVSGKRGLMGMCLHPEFSKNHYLYLAHNYRREGNSLLRVLRYRFENDTLTEPSVIIENIPASFNHTGCRLKFSPDNKLFITTGDADVPVLSQDLKALNGKTLRLNDDGSIPADNPFVRNDTARKEIYTYGHRNSQGIAFQPGTGILFNSEHGPTGGDEVNMIIKGANYGWPVAHHRDEREGMVSPLLEFTPSIGPAQAIFYQGNAFPQLKGHLLVACMRGDAILNIQLDGARIRSHDLLLQRKYGRIRALTEGPDGYLYISTSQIDPPESRLTAGSSGYDMVLRLRPGTGTARQKTRTVPTVSKPAPVAKTSRSVATLYNQLCSSCHGVDLKGTPNGVSLVDAAWLYGSSQNDIIKSLRNGTPNKGMPAWQGVLTNAEIAQMAQFIRRRMGK